MKDLLYAPNVRLYSPYWEYTNLLIFQFVGGAVMVDFSYGPPLE